ncbi:MAG: lipopolysaccharide assembly protein LapA domain-containing protein [Deltaproteobacteria bacterium]
MLRRIVAFVLAIGLAAAAALLVYLNPEEASFKLAPERSFSLPLGVIILAAAVAGALLVFVATLFREGRRAMQQWRLHRQMRSNDRTVQYRQDARALLVAGQYPKARALLDKARRLSDPDVGDLLDYARTYALEGNHAEARRALEAGQSEFGNDPVLLHALARACRRSNAPEAARSALERALAVHPRSRPLLTELRDSLFEAGSWPKAVEIQETIVGLDSGDREEKRLLLGARFEAAMVADQQQRTAMLRGIVDGAPDFAPAIIELCRRLENQGDSRSAIKMVEKAVRRQPRPILLAELERLQGDSGRPRTEKVYRKLISAHPGNDRLRLGAARVALEAGQTENAAQLLEGLSENGSVGLAHSLWAKVFESRGDREAAVHSLGEAAVQASQMIETARCATCGSSSPGWQPRCKECGAWDSLD